MRCFLDVSLEYICFVPLCVMESANEMNNSGKLQQSKVML